MKLISHDSLILDSQEYLANILQIIQGINPSVVQTIIQEHVLPIAPLDSSITFQEDFLERSGHYIFSDADSVLLPADELEN
jgi:hypothetical protein